MICLEAKSLAIDIESRNVSIDRQLEFEFCRALDFLPLELGDGFADHSQIQIEANASDVTALLAAEQVAGTANLEVFERNLHARAELVVGGNRCESVVRQIG